MIIDNYHINYKITGDGPRTLVVLQGWGTTLELYDSIAGHVNEINKGKSDEEKIKVVQLDLPGFGRSDEPRQPWDVDAYADFFIKFMEELKISEAILLGHSYGGRIIIKLAALDSLPFTISKVILLDAAGVMPKRTTKQKLKVKWYKLLKKVLLCKPIHAMFPDMIDYWKSQQGSADYRAASPMMKQCLVKAVNEDLTDILHKNTHDTLLIWGDLDTATPVSDAHIMKDLMPNAGLAVIEGTGHYSFLEKPDVFAAILASYL